MNNTSSMRCIKGRCENMRIHTERERETLRINHCYCIERTKKRGETGCRTDKYNNNNNKTKWTRTLVRFGCASIQSEYSSVMYLTLQVKHEHTAIRLLLLLCCCGERGRGVGAGRTKSRRHTRVKDATCASIMIATHTRPTHATPSGHAHK